MGLFDRLYMGKSNKPDFTPENLPTNRMQLFFEMLKLNIANLFIVNLLFDIFMLPAILWITINVVQMMEMGEAFVNEGYHNFFMLVLVPLVTLAGPAYAAMTSLCRKWARDDHVWIWSDFWHAFKDNWKQGLLIMAVMGGLLFLCYFAQQFYAVMALDNFAFFFMQLFMVIVMVIVFMAYLYIWPLMVTYELSFKQLMHNSLLMAVGRLPFSLLFGTVMLLPFILLIYIHPLIALYYPLVGFSLSAFINASYVNSVFDKYMNPRIEGAEVGRGLRKKPEWEDEEVE